MTHRPRTREETNGHGKGEWEVTQHIISMAAGAITTTNMGLAGLLHPTHLKTHWAAHSWLLLGAVGVAGARGTQVAQCTYHIRPSEHPNSRAAAARDYCHYIVNKQTTPGFGIGEVREKGEAGWYWERVPTYSKDFFFLSLKAVQQQITGYSNNFGETQRRSEMKPLLAGRLKGSNEVRPPCLLGHVRLS